MHMLIPLFHYVLQRPVSKMSKLHFISTVKIVHTYNKYDYEITHLSLTLSAPSDSLMTFS